MTQTMDQPLTIPAAGLEHRNGDVVLTAFPHPQAGFFIQGRRNGVHAPELCSRYDFEWDALQAWTKLIAEHTPAQAEPAPVKLAAPARGTATYMSPAEVVVIGQALDSTGHIRRGRGAAAADLKMLLAMAKRGFITLTGPQFRPDGGEVTDVGKRAYKEAAAAAEAQQQRADHLDAIRAIAA